MPRHFISAGCSFVSGEEYGHKFVLPCVQNGLRLERTYSDSIIESNCFVTILWQQTNSLWKDMAKLALAMHALV